MTGLENIYLNTFINGMNKAQTDKVIDGVVGFTELGEFIHQPIKTYSSGMKARLAFAVSINVEPDILIVDEALSVGDAAFQRKCFTKMEQIRRAGATILFVSHSEASIVSLCDRAIWLENGSKVLDGEPKLVTSLYLKHLNRPFKKDEVQQEYVKLIIPVVENTKAEKVVQVKKPDSKNANQKALAQNQVNLSSFNPSLKPSSTIEYESKGAQIFDVKVTDLEGKEVNILEHGKQYYYSYRVKVTQPLQQVQIGFLLKQKNGTAIGGGVYPSMMDNIECLNKSINIKFKITANLAQGEYFFNAGVYAKSNEEKDYVHRILDSYMIKVINQSPNMTSIVKIVDEVEYEEWQ
jgi:lipopolysaccharide transport system ATP-binding protein